MIDCRRQRVAGPYAHLERRRAGRWRPARAAGGDGDAAAASGRWRGTWCRSSGDRRRACRRAAVTAAGGGQAVAGAVGNLGVVVDPVDLGADLGIAALSRRSPWWCSSSWRGGWRRHGWASAHILGAGGHGGGAAGRGGGNGEAAARGRRCCTWCGSCGDRRGACRRAAVTAAGGLGPGRRWRQRGCGGRLGRPRCRPGHRGAGALRAYDGGARSCSCCGG